MQTLPPSDPLIELLRSPHGLALAMFFGALWGSFANVCIHRIPLHQSLTHPPSHCPHCQAQIAWYDNVPILGYLILRGRCRRCHARISPRYLVVEILAMAMAGVLYARFVEYGRWDGPPAVVMAQFLVYFFFSLVLLILSAIDIDHLLLPDRITLPSIVIFLILGQLVTRRLSGVSPSDALAGLTAGYVVLFVIAFGYERLTGREGLGYGDAKLLALIGGLFGWRALPFTLLMGSLCGLLIGVPLTVVARRRSKNAQKPEQDEGDALPLGQLKLPFGPFLSFGAFLYLLLLVGKDLDELLLRLLGPLFGEAV